MKSHCRKPHKTSHIRPSHHKQYAVRVENISCFFTQQVRNNKQTNVDTSITNEIHNDNTLITNDNHNDNSITNDTSINDDTSIHNDNHNDNSSITNDNQDVLLMKEGTSLKRNRRMIENALETIRDTIYNVEDRNIMTIAREQITETLKLLRGATKEENGLTLRHPES